MISVQQEDFNVAELYQQLLVESKTGAVAMFVGLVREFANLAPEECVFELVYYPGMTEHNLQRIVGEARSRWALQEIRVVHRVGCLSVSDQIVFVGVSSSHRAEALQACDFIMDYLKSQAAFWKKETQGDKVQWVEANEKDRESLERWE